MSNSLDNAVPLGVAGDVMIPLQQYVARVGQRPDRTRVLVTETERASYLAQRLSEALSRPLTSPGSEGLAQLVLSHFQDTDIMRHFAEKAIETLRDGKMHNRTAVSPNEPRVAVLFVAWNGTHRENQPQRVGNYLGPLFTTAQQLIQRGLEIVGFLEIDAYLRDNPDPDDPDRPLDEVFEVDVEYSYVPGKMFGSSAATSPPLSNTVMLNPDLCSPEEQQVLRKLMAP